MMTKTELKKQLKAYISGDYAPVICATISNPKNFRTVAEKLKPVIKETYGFEFSKYPELESFIILLVTSVPTKLLDTKFEGIGHRQFGEGRIRSYFPEINGTKFALHFDTRGLRVEALRPFGLDAVTDIYSELARLLNPDLKTLFTERFFSK